MIRQESIPVWGCGLCAVLFLILLVAAVITGTIYSMTAFSSRVLLTAAIFGTFAMGIVAALTILWKLRSSTSKSAEIVQAVGALITVIALFIAAAIYFLERRDQVKIQFEISAARALLPVSGNGARRPPTEDRTALLGIRVLITNISSQRLEVRCIALGLFQAANTPGFVRNWRSMEEVGFAPVTEPIPYELGDGDPNHSGDQAKLMECLRAEQARTRVRPFFMWTPLRLEPGEADDRYFEYPVSCRHPFVRVLVKIRVNPDDEDVYESKVIIPVDDICEGRGSGMARSVTPEGASQAGEAAPAEQVPAGAGGGAGGSRE